MWTVDCLWINIPEGPGSSFSKHSQSPSITRRKTSLYFSNSLLYSSPLLEQEGYESKPSQSFICWNGGPILPKYLLSIPKQSILRISSSSINKDRAGPFPSLSFFQNTSIHTLSSISRWWMSFRDSYTGLILHDCGPNPKTKTQKVPVWKKETAIIF